MLTRPVAVPSPLIVSGSPNTVNRRTTIRQTTSRERTALLWGTRERDQKQWFDDRVSGASLTYFPDPPSLPEKVEERVQVRFREYTQAGRTLVVWLRKLEPYGTEGENDG